VVQADKHIVFAVALVCWLEFAVALVCGLMALDVTGPF